MRVRDRDREGEVFYTAPSLSDVSAAVLCLSSENACTEGGEASTVTVLLRCFNQSFELIIGTLRYLTVTSSRKCS